MCVIVVVQNKKNIPPYDTLVKCGRTNVDGMGYMYVKDNKVIINKGFFKVKSLHDSMQNHIPDDSPAVIHFRLATHGAKTQGLCHPFPVTASYDELCMPDIECDMGVAHNGVLSSYGKIDTKYSDTQNYIATVLSFVKDHITNDGVKQLISDSIGTDKLAFLTKAGMIHMFGNFTKLEEVWYSNTYWNYSTVYTTSYKDDDSYWLRNYRNNLDDGFKVWKKCIECEVAAWTDEIGLCKICATAYKAVKEKHGDKAEKMLAKAKNKATYEECWWCGDKVKIYRRGLCFVCDAQLKENAWEVCSTCVEPNYKCAQCTLLLKDSKTTPVDTKELEKKQEDGQVVNELALDLIEEAKNA